MILWYIVMVSFCILYHVRPAIMSHYSWLAWEWNTSGTLNCFKFNSKIRTSTLSKSTPFKHLRIVAPGLTDYHRVIDLRDLSQDPQTTAIRNGGRSSRTWRFLHQLVSCTILDIRLYKFFMCENPEKRFHNSQYHSIWQKRSSYPWLRLKSWA